MKGFEAGGIESFNLITFNDSDFVAAQTTERDNLEEDAGEDRHQSHQEIVIL